MKNILSKTAIVALVSVIMSSTTSAQVKSVSAEDFVQNGADAYWVFTAVCENGSERTIQRKADADDWCGKDVEGFCEADKTKASEMICGTEYSSALLTIRETALAEQDRERELRQQQEQQQIAQQRAELERTRVQQAQAASRARREQVEQQLIDLERQRIDLIREQRELQLRAAEIQTTLDTDTNG